MHTRRFRTRPNRCCWLTLAFGALLMLASVASTLPASADQGPAGNQLAVANIDAAKCPSFQAILRYTDKRSVFIDNILNTELVVSPADRAQQALPVQLARVDDPALAVAIVADLSARVRQTGLLGRPRYNDIAERITE